MGSNRDTMLSRKKKKKKPTKFVEKDGKQNEVEEESKKKMSSAIKKKRRRVEGKDAHSGKAVNMSNESAESADNETIEAQTTKKNDKSSRKKKRKNGEINVVKSNKLGSNTEDGSLEDNDVGAAEQIQSETLGKNESSKVAGMLKKSGKKRKGHITSKEGKKSLEKREGPHTDISFGKDEDAEAEDVYYISSGDDDCSKGMKKWILGYHQSRPGLKVLQERIDEFITAHEAQLEQERKEREARAAEGGWTVVVHHKGRKKTTDSESGITVGSVSQAVVEDKMTKKKHKEVGLDFYRFQRREAQRNEIMMLQSKFEQDKKRIQQLRAARKFRPY